ncbi:MAG: carbon-nitrogen hydrolase family protein [Corynebacterium sp.]|nr:carbon-nitrogen hydrolase family protein [Corynebacterium sp.]
MKIALAQITSGSDKMENLRLVRAAVADAAEKGAQLVIFPEATMQGFGTGRLDTGAETETGPFTTALCELVKQYRIGIVAGVFYIADQIQQDGKAIQRVANVALAVLPASKDAAEDVALVRYDKIHTFDAFGFKESATVCPGDQLVTFDYQGICFGLATCYDVRFPELFRQLAHQGAQVIILPASWGTGAGKQAQWELLTQARALDSGSYILACDQASAQEERTAGAPTGLGASAVINPWGRRIAHAGDDPELVFADIDIVEVAAAREAIGVLAHAENYSAIAHHHYGKVSS